MCMYLYFFSEKLREILVPNYKNVVEEIETSIIKETLQKYVEIHNINEEFRSFLPETGKSRQDRVYRFLTFILKNDEYVLELEKVFRQNNLEHLLEEKHRDQYLIEEKNKEKEYALASNAGITIHYVKNVFPFLFFIKTRGPCTGLNGHLFITVLSEGLLFA